jgi:imidazolonepropionase-like amidohydrolase
VPDLAAGDVHVRDGAIVAVAQKIEAPSARVVDCAGMICIPGFIDTHFHLWNSMFRLFVRADVPTLGYFPVTARLGPLMGPEDSYRSVRLGTAEALAAGVTTLHNWAHNTRTPEHADAELSAMRDVGVRGRFAYGTPVGLSDDAPMDFAGLARVKKDWMPDKDNLLTLGICSRNLGALTIGGSAAAASRGVLTIEQIKRDWDGARALGLPITMHTGRAAQPRRPARPSAADHDRGAGDPQGARRQLLDLAPARGAPVVAAWRHPARRTAGGRRQGQPVDGSRRLR